MTDTAENPRAVIGSNAPPPLIAHISNIEDLYAEARLWLDGKPIASDADAEGVAKLLTQIREARKAADEQRKVEKKPHDDAGKAVQEAWTPLLAKCDLAAGAAKDALTPWQIAKEAEQRAAADKARKEADDAAERAQAALRASTNLEAREDAEELLKAAGKADKAAKRLDNAKPQVSGGGKAIGLRTYWIAEMADRRLALAHYMTTRPDDLTAWLLDMAQKDVSAGKRDIPGINAKEDKRAV